MLNTTPKIPYFKDVKINDYNQIVINTIHNIFNNKQLLTSKRHNLYKNLQSPF